MIHQNQRHKEAGFTFLEALFVLSIVSLISIITLSLYPKYESRKAEDFLEQFQRDLVFMQQSAISHNVRHRLHWFAANHRYVITKGDTGALIVRDYDPDVQIRFDTLAAPIIYGPDGNINKGGTMYVSYKNKKYKVVFQLGKGRFYYIRM
ncbi:competence type IV pilus minor pilin ComGD [Ectobacillus panaciterrae]|uniref:competence type IV pilus minor pilin ComGD n=1 Tax=Ectobacillus panaciterrae TaxID=363872 RepID=UPI0003F56FE6|nr:competence type IV pilus minor pilin ComGD [Ectobacillus panaciterrae]